MSTRQLMYWHFFRLSDLGIHLNFGEKISDNSHSTSAHSKACRYCYEPFDLFFKMPGLASLRTEQVHPVTILHEHLCCILGWNPFSAEFARSSRACTGFLRVLRFPPFSLTEALAKNWGWRRGAVCCPLLPWDGLNAEYEFHHVVHYTICNIYIEELLHFFLHSLKNLPCYCVPGRCSGDPAHPRLPQRTHWRPHPDQMPGHQVCHTFS